MKEQNYVNLWEMTKTEFGGGRVLPPSVPTESLWSASVKLGLRTLLCKNKNRVCRILSARVERNWEIMSDELLQYC